MMLPLAFVGILAFASAESEVNERGAPWRQNLQEESFYRQCQSSCTEYSKGVTTRVELCDDTEVCRGQKVTFDEYATEQCTGWSEDGTVPDVVLRPEGRRFKYEPTKYSWLSCAVFCRVGDSQWYTPRSELGRAAFFPDGTWCHREGGRDYFCQKNLCLPENYEFSEAVRAADLAMEGLDDSFIEDNNIIDL